MRRFHVSGVFRVAAFSILLLSPAGARGEDDPLAPGPERPCPELGVAFRVPGGIDPGPPSPAGEFGGRNLAFYFGLSEDSKVEVRIEHYPTFDHLPSFVRRLKGKGPGANRKLETEAPVELAGFEEAVRLEWEPDAGGRRTIQIVARRFRAVQLFGFTLPPGNEERLRAAVEAVISSLRSTAEIPSGLPVPKGWRVHATEHYEITTDADPALSEAVGDLLESGWTTIHRAFPEARIPRHRAVVRLHGTVEDLVRFREAHRLPEEETAFLFEDERVLVTGPLPKGKQTRRFGRWQVDMHQILWRQFEQFLLHAAGTRPDPWFAEGGGLWLGLGFSPELRFEAKDAAEELALGIEEALISRKAITLADLFERTSLTEDERTVAASWFHFFMKGPGQGKKGRLAKYLSTFSESWDGKKARKEALGKDTIRRLTKAHARYYIYLAWRSRRRR